MTTADGLKAAMPLLEPKHFVAPFLAHALGTFVGALVGVRIAVSRRAMVASVIGILFLCGGIAASFMIPAPGWFIALDLLAAYLPMAWIALRLGDRNSTR
jgi:ABC-type multidrug transport system permease subunit